MAENIPEKADFQKALGAWLNEAQEAGNPFVDIRADELHSRVGDYPGPFHRMATCCEVMYEIYVPSEDKILQFPPKGKGASMEIRYSLPRKKVNDGQKGKTVPTQRKTSFTVKCEYCHGTGRDVRNLSANQDLCPAPGCSVKKQGLHTLPGQIEDYHTCKRCSGNGVNPPKTKTIKSTDNLNQPCTDCCGTGIVKR